jgi:very-short-patch-repair endonuclease
VVEAGGDAAERRSWDALLAEVESVRAEATSCGELLLAHAPKTAEDIPPERASEVYEAIAVDVRQSGKPPGYLTLLMRREWKRAIDGASVADGAKIRLPEHFEALAAWAKLSQKRETLRRRWRLQVEAIGGPSADSLGDEVEGSCRKFASLIRRAIDWWSKTLVPSIQRISATGFLWDAAQAEADARFVMLDGVQRVHRIVGETLPPAFTAELARRRWSELGGEIARLRSATEQWPQSRPAMALRRSLDVLEPDGYRSAYKEIERLFAQTRRVRLRSDLLKRLERAAADWVGQIRARASVHGSASVPGDVNAAWRWRQLEDELNRRDAVSLPDLLRRLDERRGILRELTAELADRRAWRAQATRTSLPQRQALMGFASAKKRIGKGTGKRAARLAKMARELMTEARSAVPVWIMPIVKAAEVFDPRSTRFDVVIVDESSQCEVTGLLAMYLGRQVVVVGDDEQVSPSAVGEKTIDAQHLIDAYLQGIPNKQLYDGHQSLYDIAKQSFGGTICLLEHFRCVPDIIRFSNALSYDGSLKPLREARPDDPAPAVVAHRVSSAGTFGKVNEDEAVEVAALVAAAIEQPEYRGKSFGIISMVGDDQAYRIETLLRKVVPQTEIEQRRLLTGSAAQFQGDERNVMFLSMVDTGDGTPLRMDRETKSFQQRFNVAASRAQDQMWVVYSLDPGLELKSGDIRRRLIEHALDPSALARSEAAALARAESPFEVEVIQRLSAAGYGIKTQYSVGAYRIDIVVEGVGGKKRLAVECDGDRYHRIEDLQKDVERQMILERLGWTFVRIRGSSFYRDRDAAMHPVFERLRSMGITPLERHHAVEQGVDADELLGRVRARAAEIRADIQDLSERAPYEKKRESRRGRQLRIVS